MIDNVILLLTGTLHERDTRELLDKCHPLGLSSSFSHTFSPYSIVRSILCTQTEFEEDPQASSSLWPPWPSLRTLRTLTASCSSTPRLVCSLIDYEQDDLKKELGIFRCSRADSGWFGVRGVGSRPENMRVAICLRSF